MYTYMFYTTTPTDFDTNIIIRQDYDHDLRTMKGLKHSTTKYQSLSVSMTRKIPIYMEKLFFSKKYTKMVHFDIA